MQTFFKKIIYIWLCWVFIAVHELSLVAASQGYSSLRCAGFSFQWLLQLRSTDSRSASFSSCGTRAQQLWLTGSRAQAQQLQRTGLVAPWHVGSSRTRDQTCVPCIGRWILNHCATRDVWTLNKFQFPSLVFSSGFITLSQLTSVFQLIIDKITVPILNSKELK